MDGDSRIIIFNRYRNPVDGRIWLGNEKDESEWFFVDDPIWEHVDSGEDAAGASWRNAETGRIVREHALDVECLPEGHECPSAVDDGTPAPVQDTGFIDHVDNESAGVAVPSDAANVIVDQSLTQISSHGSEQGSGSDLRSDALRRWDSIECGGQVQTTLQKLAKIILEEKASLEGKSTQSELIDICFPKPGTSAAKMCEFLSSCVESYVLVQLIRRLQSPQGCDLFEQWARFCQLRNLCKNPREVASSPLVLFIATAMTAEPARIANLISRAKLHPFESLVQHVAAELHKVNDGIGPSNDLMFATSSLSSASVKQATANTAYESIELAARTDTYCRSGSGNPAPVAKTLQLEASGSRLRDIGLTGSVRKSSTTFGFICQDECEEDLFFLPSDCVGFNYVIPPSGTRVKYNVMRKQRAKGPKAFNVQKELCAQSIDLSSMEPRRTVKIELWKHGRMKHLEVLNSTTIRKLIDRYGGHSGWEMRRCDGPLLFEELQIGDLCLAHRIDEEHALSSPRIALELINDASAW